MSVSKHYEAKCYKGVSDFAMENPVIVRLDCARLGIRWFGVQTPLATAIIEGISDNKKNLVQTSTKLRPNLNHILSLVIKKCCK